jgi:hypothetical protein
MISVKSIIRTAGFVATVSIAVAQTGPTVQVTLYSRKVRAL